MQRRRRNIRNLWILFLQMKELSQLLRKRRQERGAIDFDFPESKILLDAKGRPIEIAAV